MTPRTPTRHAPGPFRHFGHFRDSEDGSLIIFSLYVLICMMLAIGISLDTVRFEYTRAKLQATLDRAVLAAADLEQVLDPEDVVEDYFSKAGLLDQLVSVTVSQGVNYKTVSAESEAQVDTIFLDMLGIEDFIVPASGTANETLADMEIALVLDNSGSMGQNNNARLNLLKPAAKEFIDTVIHEDTTLGKTTVSIIPFATQVSVGENILDLYKNVSDEHHHSHCVTFDNDQFLSTELGESEALQRVGHFDPYTSQWTLDTPVCETDASRVITPWSQDAAYLKQRIDAMYAEGATSIEIGAKWGVTMLDPKSGWVLDGLADAGVVDTTLKAEGQPYAYGRENTRKVLVIMSDGENTNDYDLHDDYRSGNSPLYYGNGRYSFRYQSNHGTHFYVRKDSRSGYWSSEPYGGSNARRLTWPDVWADMSVIRYAYEFPRKVFGGDYMTYYYQIVDKTASGTKNTRTSNVCKTAKDAGILVFTIGMDTYGDGDATLLDCATQSTYFYDVESIDISNAFQAIALQINQLRLTQ